MKKEAKIVRLTEQQFKQVIKESVQQILMNEAHRNQEYLNMDVTLRKGGRNAVKMSPELFENLVKATYMEYAIQEDENPLSVCNRPSLDHFVYKLCYGTKQHKKNPIVKDLYHDIWEEKYKFDSENVDCVNKVKTTKHGVPYIECDAGGDWECPVCFFVYYDGSKFRGYIPLKGNAINPENKTAFQGDEEENEVLRKILGPDTKLTSNDVRYNVNACLEDFTERLTVKGTADKAKIQKYIDKMDEEWKQYKDKKKKEREKEEKRKAENAELTQEKFEGGEF